MDRERFLKKRGGGGGRLSLSLFSSPRFSDIPRLLPAGASSQAGWARRRRRRRRATGPFFPLLFWSTRGRVARRKKKRKEKGKTRVKRERLFQKSTVRLEHSNGRRKKKKYRTMSAPLASGQRTISSFFAKSSGAVAATATQNTMKRPASAVAAAAMEPGKRRAVSCLIESMATISFFLLLSTSTLFLSHSLSPAKQP